MTKATLNDMRTPFDTIYLIQLEAKRLGNKIPHVNEEFVTKFSKKNDEQLKKFLEDSSQHVSSVEVPTENLRYAILPNESSVLPFLN